MTAPTPTLVRLEYLTPDGWVCGHAGINLLDPQRYVDRLLDRRKFGRAIVLDDRLQPRGRVYAPPDLPDPSQLVPTATRVPGLPDPERRGMCPHCDSYHGDPFDGTCLL